jgi:hypothetical protein
MFKIAVVLFLTICPAWASTLVQDFSFESPIVGSPGYSYRPTTGTPWNFGSGSDGITVVAPDPTTGFGMTSTESGNQAAFIQRANSQISQTITGLTVGQAYQVGFFAATRPDFIDAGLLAYGGGEDFSVLWNGNQIGLYLPTSTTFSYYISNYFKATSTTGVLSFVGIDSNNGGCQQDTSGNCDRTAFIDAVNIHTPEPPETVLLLSGILLIGAFLGRDFVKMLKMRAL